jgi:hypothetical protein
MMLILFGGCTTAGSQQNSDITGITVGAEEVYLTLEGEPYVLSVKKP